MNYFIGLDIGTSAAKAVLMSETGSVLGTASGEYDMQSPRPLWSEQDPENWWTGTQKAIKELLYTHNIKGEDVKAVGLTGQMHGLVTLDSSGKVLYPCIMWNDQRTASECAEMTDLIGYDNLLKITGNPVLPGFTAPKILWLRKHKPEVFNNINKILLPKDYLRFKLTNEFFTDVSDASGTSLLNVGQRKWSEEILNKLKIPFSWLPEVVESVTITGTISHEAAVFTGLKEGTPVIAGGGDQASGAVGTGAVSEGIISLVLGTSGVVFTPTKNFRIEPEGKLHSFCHAVPGAWHFMGVTLSAAGSLKWFRDTFYPGEKYEELTDGVENIPAGSEGLIFLPYLSGERTPYPDPDAKGTFTGISVRHNKNYFTRSILEGVAYSLRDCYELIKRSGINAEKILVSGGGAKSRLWRQIISDLFNLEIRTLKCTEGAPYGAAIIAATGTGYYKSIEEACKAILEIETITFPDKNTHIIYEDFYQLYAELYPDLKKSFKNISKKVNKHYGS
jgi:xylulokinase